MNWHNLDNDDYFLFARSYYTAAKKLARFLDLEPGPIPDFDLCPVLSAYRHAIELHLKVIVLGDGGNFLPKKPDEISVHKTRSLSWLAQFVVQIVTNLKWEDEFKTEGIDSVVDFQAVIEEVNHIDPTFHAFRCPSNAEGTDAVTSTLRDAVVGFVRRLDALIGLLESTADALAAEWDLRSDAAPDDQGDDGGFKPTIQ